MQKQRQQPSARMSKSVTLLLVSLCVVDEALSLNCFTSNFTSLTSGNLQNLTHKLQDCEDYISEMPSSSAEIPEMLVLRCFIIRADYLGVVFKGCLPEGQCVNMTKAFTQMLQSGGSITPDAIGDVDCSECKEDLCNAEDTFVFTNNSILGIVPDILPTVTTVNNNQSCGLQLKLINVCLLLYSIYLYR